MAEIKDSGSRREFGTGAVRDACEGKGRMDLVPLWVAGRLIGGSVEGILRNVDGYVRSGDLRSLYKALSLFAFNVNKTKETLILDVSKQYEDGCQKYGDRNWENGIPLHCYIDSGCRHLLKHSRGDTDEPHDRAFVWNMLGAIWTHENKPELIDLPFNLNAKGEGK